MAPVAEVGESLSQTLTRLLFQNCCIPMSSEISDLLLFVSYFASQSQGIKFGDYFLMCLCKSKVSGKMSD